MSITDIEVAALEKAAKSTSYYDLAYTGMRRGELIALSWDAKDFDNNTIFIKRAVPPKNVILTYDDITLQTGTLEHVEFGLSLINWSNSGGR